MLQSVSKLSGFAHYFTIILSCFPHIAVVLGEEQCSALARQDKYLAHDSKTFGAAACSSGSHRSRLTVRELEMPRSRIVLRELSRVIAEFHRLASECGQSARLSCDPKSNEIYSVMERHWNSLAQSYEGIERLKDR